MDKWYTIKETPPWEGGIEKEVFLLKQDFVIEGMTCSACSAAVDRAVSKIDGVDKVNVNLLTHSMDVAYDPGQVDDSAIVEAVEKAGYGARPKKEEASSSEGGFDLAKIQEEEEAGLKMRLKVSLAFMIPLMYIAMAPMMGLPSFSFLEGEENLLVFAFTQMLMTLPVMYVNRSYYINGFKALASRHPNMDSLVAIGSGAAFVYGVFVIYRMAYGFGHGDLALVHHYAHSLYFESAAMILALITVGKYLEARSKGRTTDAITKLMDLSPKTAIRLEGGAEVEVPVEEIAPGDILLVRPGSAVPVDGRIIEGQGAFDESAITGESMPVDKGEGETIIGSTLLKLGSIKMEAVKVGDDTTLSQIIDLVQEASASKAPISKLADRVASIFVPAVILIALVATGVWLLLGQSFEFAMTIGISILVISCPCALGLATPVAIMVGTGKGASNGILIKSAESLETLHDVDAVVLDKTGTITQGQPAVTDVVLLGDLDHDDFISLAASLEAPSEHTLSLAILDYAKENDLAYSPASGFVNHLGKGIEGQVEGLTYYAGNRAYLEEEGFDLEGLDERASALADEGKTALYFASKDEVLGIIAVADPVKATSKQAIDLLKDQDIETIMLTGDNERTARAIGRPLGLDRVIAQVMPQDKDSLVQEIQEADKKVAMVGDGINDAPALARADVGIAIGAGTDIAMEAGDLVLMKSDLLDVVNAIDLSHATIRNIKQNLFWAFFYNILFIPVAAGVLYPAFGITLNPMFAAAAMSLSSVFVVTNALRLNRFEPVHGDPEGGLDQVMTDVKIVSENPGAVTRSQKTSKGEDKMKKTMIVEGMTCQHCKARVEDALNSLDKVDRAEVNLETKEVSLEVQDGANDKDLREAVTDAGYDVVEVK